MKNPLKSNPEKNRPSAPNSYVKYTGIAFQMIAIILAGTFGGIKLDNVVERIEFPVFTLIFTFLAVCFSIYYSIKDFIRMK